MDTNSSLVDTSSSERTYYEGPSDSSGDEHMRIRYFTRMHGSQLVSGVVANVLFTIDRPAKVVWPYMKDFNRWQKGHYYSGVVGDLAGKTFGLGFGTKEPQPHYYEVPRVIPEFLIIINQPVPADGTTAGMPGRPGVSPGFHVFMLNDHGSKTTVSIYMEHSSIADSLDKDVALKPWRDLTNGDWQRKWRDEFIHDLKELVYTSGRSGTARG